MPCQTSFKPIDAPTEDEIHIDKEANEKSPSQRLRAVLYRIWEQDPKDYKTFEEYYRVQMDKLVEKLKERLPSFDEDR